MRYAAVSNVSTSTVFAVSLPVLSALFSAAAAPENAAGGISAEVDVTPASSTTSTSTWASLAVVETAADIE